ncbi:hypothetical protein B0H14DRAFT_3489730 [Mycena olivaceomarginata]|nr:hypothetical protein B0H14DRAFT_3489730 [Mycena olivaceomarginata]
MRNAALLDALNLRHASAQILGPPKPTPRPRPRHPPRTQRSTTILARGGDEDDEEGGDEDDEEGGDKDDEEGGELDEETGRDDGEREEDGGQGKSTPDDTAPQDKSEWPKWMRDGSALLDACPAAGSEEWADAGEDMGAARGGLWVPNYDGSTTLETRLETSGGAPSGSSMAVRLPERHRWRINDKLVEKWWGWWTSLAPEWRKKDETGRPAISEVVGDWGEGKRVKDPAKDWAAAVRDVLWVLKGLLSAAKNKYATPIHTLDTALITAVTAIRNPLPPPSWTLPTRRTRNWNDGSDTVANCQCDNVARLHGDAVALRCYACAVPRCDARVPGAVPRSRCDTRAVLHCEALAAPSNRLDAKLWDARLSSSGSPHPRSLCHRRLASSQLQPSHPRRFRSHVQCVTHRCRHGAWAPEAGVLEVLEVRGAGVGEEGTVDADAGENVEAAREVEAVLRIGRVGHQTL